MIYKTEKKKGQDSPACHIFCLPTPSFMSNLSIIHHIFYVNNTKICWPPFLLSCLPFWPPYNLDTFGVGGRRRERGHSLIIFSISTMVLANLHFQYIFCGHSLFLFYLEAIHIIHPSAVPTGNHKRANWREFNKRMIYQRMGRVRGNEHGKVECARERRGSCWRIAIGEASVEEGSWGNVFPSCLPLAEPKTDWKLERLMWSIKAHLLVTQQRGEGGEGSVGQRKSSVTQVHIEGLVYIELSGCSHSL